MISFLEYPVKITVILVSHCCNNVTDGQICVTHQLYGFIQTFPLKQFLEIKACGFLDHLAEHMHGQMKQFTQLSESCSFVFLFYVIQGCHGNHVFVLIWHTHFHILYRIHQIQKNQSHSCLVDPVIFPFSCYQRIDHILQQILDLQNL